MLSFILRKKVLVLLLCFTLGAGYELAAQVITGRVTDENGETLPGANVTVKGTTRGTVTNHNGRYSLEVSPSDEVLEFSFLGYIPEEVSIDGRDEIDVQLIPTLESIDEVVVIGYGTTSRRDLTGSVASVSSDQIRDMPVSSVAQAITGRLAGVQITTAEGSPDAEVRIRVRGGGSITQDNSPLYIVDGFPVDNINNISPSDIQSIDVLKDASSTAIYGARGANGVVIITTKAGRVGATQVSYNFYYAQKELASKLPVMDPYEYALYQYERSRGNFQERSSYELRMGQWDQLVDLYGDKDGTDWQDEVFGRIAPTVYHNVGISGGTEQTTYNLSLTRQEEDGIMINSGFERTNLGFRFDNQATEKFSINFDARYSDTKTLGVGSSDPGTQTTNRLRHAVIYRPVEGLSDLLDDPNLSFTDEENWSLSRLIDPVTLINDEYRLRHRQEANYNFAFNYSFIESLTWRTELGYENRSQRTDRFYGVVTPLARDYGELPVVRYDERDQERIRLVNTFTFSQRNIADEHNITALLGQEMVETERKEYSQEIRHFPADISSDIAIGSMSLGATPLAPSTFEITDRLLSYFGRVNYSFKDNYLLSVTVRADGSSKFGAENRWGVFPSASGAWRISGEEFMLNVTTISSLKLRASYGQAGNDRIPEYLYSNLFKVSSHKGYYLNNNRMAYFRPDALANPFLKWETMVTRNIGLDFGLFSERLHGNIDVYQNTTQDLLINQRIDVTTGYTEQMQNIGQTTNRGIELALNAYIIERRDFRLSTNFNISFNRNTVDDLGPNADHFLAGSNWSNDVGADYIVRVGDPVGLMYGFETDGFYTADEFTYDPETEEYILNPGIANNQQVVTFGFGPGSVKFVDQANPVDEDGNPIDDGNAVTFEDDRVVIGNSNPKHIGGLNIMSVYKNWDLSVFMNWVYGNDVYNANKIEFTSGYRSYTNQLNTMNSENRWRTIDSDGVVVTDLAQLQDLNQDATIWKPTEGRYLFHSWAVEDGSFLRISNVTLGYTIPTRVSERVLITNMRVYATVNNLYTFTNYSGYDPEVDTRRRTPVTPGVDYSAYPRSRMYLFGLNLTF